MVHTTGGGENTTPANVKVKEQEVVSQLSRS